MSSVSSISNKNLNHPFFLETKLSNPNDRIYEQLDFSSYTNASIRTLWGIVKGAQDELQYRISFPLMQRKIQHHGSMPKNLLCFTSSLLNGGVVSNATVNYLADIMMKKHSDFVIEKSFFIPFTKPLDNYENFSSICIPINLRGYLRDHVVLLAYNPKEEKVLFFDSKGSRMKDLWNYQIVGKDQLTLGEVFEQMNTTFFKEKSFNLLENTYFAQSGSLDCGVFLLDALDRISSGQKYEEILCKPLHENNAKSYRRSDFITDIVGASEYSENKDGYVLISVKKD